MSFKPVKARAKELLSYGMGKQQVYLSLMQEFPDAKPKRVAEDLRFRATEADKERFKGPHRLLLALVVLSAAWRVTAELMQEAPEVARPWSFLPLVPIASLLVGYSLYAWQGQLFQWVGWGNALGIFGLMKEVGAVVAGEMDGVTLVPKLLSVVLGALTLYLAHNVFAKPQEIRDEGSGKPVHYVFPETPFS
ncbi:MAG: hypothetical protein MUE88_08080 [Flavobacteriales bacterium]|jgi:hypothetical protein|nr:hypothetical protein [Flavobacteriales bacterium]